MKWYLKVLKQYLDFSGRARRKEYWMFLLGHFAFICATLFLIILSSETFSDSTKIDTPSMLLIFILSVYLLGTSIPFLAVTVRRLHDTGKSGWWYLICILPFIGRFVILIFTCIDSEIKPNQWGANPKGIGNDGLIDQIGKE
jgi:uncharacterized membrane protein YhaH (DUF805 family)